MTMTSSCFQLSVLGQVSRRMCLARKSYILYMSRLLTYVSCTFHMSVGGPCVPGPVSVGSCALWGCPPSCDQD